MRYCIVVFCLLFVISQPSVGQDIFTLVQDGHLDQARQMLSSRDPFTLTDGNLLYCAGKLDENATRAARLFERSLNYSPKEPFREEMMAHLVEYYYLSRDIDKMGGAIASYFMQYPDARHRREVERYSVLLAQLRKEHDVAIRQADRFLTENKSGDMVQWLAVDKARSMQAMGKNIGAAKILKDLSKEKSGPGVPLSLYMLAMTSINATKTDDAVLYFNLLQEEYPSAVGCDAIMERLSPTIDTMVTDNRAERITSTYYSVKVGVFSDKENASKMARQVNAIVRTAKVEMEPKVISGKSYQVVYVGRFSSFGEATKLKQQLEAELEELFQVVAR